jgi:hypothetical protein
MKRIALVVLLLVTVVWGADPPVRREAIEWCDAWLPHMNEQDLPRVLLIGDSITRGYYTVVEQNLKSNAYVARVTTSKAVGDPALLAEIAAFIGQVKFDVVHFNVGMHGWAYSEDEYRQHFPALVQAIRRGAPGARLIWGSTTPIRKDRPPGATNARIEARNGIAREIARVERIPINDLHSLMAGRGGLHSDDFHFNKEGNDLMGAQVAAEVAKLLPAR